MNDNRIAEIQQRCEAATPSPWEVEKYYHDEPYEQFIKSAAVVSTYEDGSKRTITRNNWSNPVVADLEFIAHAREDIPYLLAQLAERDKEIERLKASRLVVLSCKVGDTVYLVLPKCRASRIPLAECNFFECDDCPRNKREIFEQKATTEMLSMMLFEKYNTLYVFGKTVFLTRAEAEAALKGGTT